MTYDIFISYRRDGGEYTAKLLHDRLTQLGYSVFFDVESLRSGEFNRELFDIIENCTDFLVVLSPGSLERCQNEGDWVRLEIAHALQKGKNIVPIMLRNFKFPATLPPDIDRLRWNNGVQASTEFFDAFFEKMLRFLHAKPSRHKSRGKGKKWLIVAAFSLLIFAVAGGILWQLSKLNQTDGSKQSTLPGSSLSSNVSESETGKIVPEGKRLFENEKISFLYPEDWILVSKDAQDCPTFSFETELFIITDITDDLSYDLVSYVSHELTRTVEPYISSARPKSFNTGTFSTLKFGEYDGAYLGCVYTNQQYQECMAEVCVVSDGNTRVSAVVTEHREGEEWDISLTDILDTLVIY